MLQSTLTKVTNLPSETIIFNCIITENPCLKAAIEKT